MASDVTRRRAQRRQRHRGQRRRTSSAHLIELTGVGPRAASTGPRRRRAMFRRVGSQRAHGRAARLGARARPRDRPARRRRLRGGRDEGARHRRVGLRRAAPDPRAGRATATRSSRIARDADRIPQRRRDRARSRSTWPRPLDDVALPQVDAIVHLAQANVPFPDARARALPRQHARDARAARCLRAHGCRAASSTPRRARSTGSASGRFARTTRVARHSFYATTKSHAEELVARVPPTCSTARSPAVLRALRARAGRTA